MGLNGEKMLQNLKRLSQVDKMKQVEPLSYALFPGYHCPLMGAMLTIRAIKDSVMLVLGPDECAYYTKMATSGNGSMSADGCQIVSVVLEQHDVTFGCQEKLEEAMKVKTDFLNRMSHDIRTPLNGILGLIEIDSRHPQEYELLKMNRTKAKVAANYLLSLLNI